MNFPCKRRNALRFGHEQLVFGRIIFNRAIGLAINAKNYAWEKSSSAQSSNSGDGAIDKSWPVGWGLVQKARNRAGFPHEV